MRTNTDSGLPLDHKFPGRNLISHFYDGIDDTIKTLLALFDRSRVWIRILNQQRGRERLWRNCRAFSHVCPFVQSLPTFKISSPPPPPPTHTLSFPFCCSICLWSVQSLVTGGTKSPLLFQPISPPTPSLFACLIYPWSTPCPQEKSHPPPPLLFPLFSSLQSISSLTIKSNLF